MIPESFTSPEQKSTGSHSAIDQPLRTPVSLLNLPFQSRSCTRHLDALSKIIARAEYLYYSGSTEEAARILEPYLESDDTYLRNTACLLYMYANLSGGHTHLVKYTIAKLQEYSKRHPGYIKIPSFTRGAYRRTKAEE